MDTKRHHTEHGLAVPPLCAHSSPLNVLRLFSPGLLLYSICQHATSCQEAYLAQEITSVHPPLLSLQPEGGGGSWCTFSAGSCSLGIWKVSACCGGCRPYCRLLPVCSQCSSLSAGCPTDPHSGVLHACRGSEGIRAHLEVNHTLGWNMAEPCSTALVGGTGTHPRGDAAEGHSAPAPPHSQPLTLGSVPQGHPDWSDRCRVWFCRAGGPGQASVLSSRILLSQNTLF